jgi:hypothetical protein
MSAAEIRNQIGGSWEERSDGWWLPLPPEQIRAAAGIMLAGSARFVAQVASPGSQGEFGLPEFGLSWHWDLKGTLLSITTTLAAGRPAPSIVDIYVGADWAERETRDYYAITFEGRDATPTLMLRAEDAPGIMLPPEAGRP